MLSDADTSREFLTAAGLPNYLAVMSAAAERVAAYHRTPPAIGRIDGHDELYRTLAPFGSMPRNGMGVDAVLDELAEVVLPTSLNVSDPRYLAHLHCPPTISSLGAEVVLTAINQSMDSFDQAPAGTVLEQLVLDWLCRSVGYAEGDGVFTSGGTQSNLQGLLLARDNHARSLGWDVATRGLHPSAPTWRIICTAETHFTVLTAARLLGLGAGAIVHADTDPDGRMSPRSLADRIDDCRHRGETVLAVVATAGTTSRGAIDPLPEISELVAQHGIWLHVDAAAGGALALTPTHRHLLAGCDAADSMSIDFHKLLFQPISCSALLVRRRETLDVVRYHADYLNPDDDADVVNLVDRSLQTTRRFDALKVLVTVRSLGTDAVAAMIDRTVHAARAAAGAVTADPRLVLLAPCATNTVVFRWEPTGVDADTVDAVNAAVRRDLAHAQRAIVGRTTIDGRIALKLTFVNPVCTTDMARSLVAVVAGAGDQQTSRSR